MRSVKAMVVIVLSIVGVRAASAQDSWTRITPGEMTRDKIENVLGVNYQRKATFDAEYVVYRNVLEANEIRIKYDGGNVDEVIVYPRRSLREADIVALYGGAKQAAGTSSDGLGQMSYPIGGALVAYNANGYAQRITLRGGVARNGIESTITNALQNELMNALTGKKKP